MTGKNRHYIPRFYQGYFLNTSNPNVSYTRSSYKYYLSLIKEENRNKLINIPSHKKSSCFFNESGQEFFGLDLSNENLLKDIESKEKRLLERFYTDFISCGINSINCKLKKNKLANDFLNNFIIYLNIRSVTETNLYKFAAEYFIDDNINQIIKMKKIKIKRLNKIREVLLNIFTKDTSKIKNEKYNLFKKIYNTKIENKLTNKNDLYFEYCDIISLPFSIYLTDITTLTLINGKLSLLDLEGNKNCDNIIFLLNKNTILYYKKNNKPHNIPIYKLNTFLKRNATDFIISEKLLYSKNLGKFNYIYDDFLLELDCLIGRMILNCNTGKKIRKLKIKALKLINNMQI